ncbi:MAG TPA: dicarboxylate/amino acid:cation symporter [Planctomycetota bacterium]|nr:dicarboxylate/amino acid:cation symporter [Planctomycetota bacterium]
MKRLLTLPNLIMAALFLGIAFGAAADRADLFTKLPSLQALFVTVGAIFKNLIFMIIVPLVVFTLIGGMMGIGDLRKLGRIAWKTLAIYLATAAVACLIAVALVNLAKPGSYVPAETRDRIANQYQKKQKEMVTDAAAVKPTLWTFFRDMVPTNVFSAASDKDNRQMLPLIFFSIFFGLAAASLEAGRRERFAEFVATITDIMLRMIRVIMWIAPAGVFCLISVSIATTGLSVMGALAAYAAVVIVGLLLHLFVVYQVVIRLMTKLKFGDFLRASRPALLTAFGTSSSAASLPMNMECVTKRLNVSSEVTSFVLPIGTTVNMDGTAIMQAVATVFLAQLYSIPLGIADQIFIILMAMLAAIGTAPIPSAGIAMLFIILGPLNIPLEGIALIWAVDRPLDMARTVVNVAGDGVAAAAVAASEGEDVKYIPAA